MGPSSTSNKQTTIDNEQGWIIPNPKKVCKDQTRSDVSLIELNSINNKISNATQSNFHNGSVQNNSKQVTKNIEKKKMYEAKKGDSEKVIQQQCSILKTQDIKSSQQANVNLTQEGENKAAKNIEAELKARLQKLESEIKKLSNDFIKALKESESKTDKCESLQIECELLKHELEEKDNELQQRAKNECDYKIELFALQQECLKDQEKMEKLISNLENKLKKQVVHLESIKQELSEAVQKLNNIEAKKIEDLSRVFKPTTSDLILNLEKIMRLVKSLDVLVINSKNINTNFTKDLNRLKEKPNQLANVLQVHLTSSDEKYKELIESYVSIAQKYELEKIEFLKDSISIEESSKFPISEIQYNNISARFSIPLDEVLAGNKLFEETAKLSNEAFSNLNKLYEVSKITLNLFKIDLDNFDIEISELEKPLGWFDTKPAPKVKRFSPLDSEFNGIGIK